MPKLPRAEQKTIYSPARMPNLVGDGYTAAARGEAAIGQAVQQLGRGIGALGAGLEAAGQMEDKEDEYRAKMALVDFTNRVHADDMIARQSFTGDMDPNGWAEKRMEYYRGESSRVMEGIRSPKARQQASLYFARHGGAYQRGAIQFEGVQRVNRLVSNTQGTITGGFEMVDLQNFSSLPQEEQANRIAALEAQIKGAAAMAREMPGASEEQRAKVWNHTSALAIKKLEALPDELRATIAERLQREWTAAEQAQTPQGAVSLDGIAPAGTPPETLKAVASVAQTIGANPSAIAGVIDTESKWNPRAQTGSYMGLTQVSPVTLREMGVSVEQYRAMSQPEQAAFYGRWLQHYKFNEKMEAAGIDFKALPPARQAAVLQAFQFAPNGAWIERYGKGDTATPVTNTKQARALGSTSIADMEAYYSKRIPRSGQGATPGAKPENQGAQVAYKPPGTPGFVAAITDQTERKFTPQGYGERVTGKITVNGRTYEFVNGGTGRGSIPLGEYEIKRFTSGSQRAREGFSYRKDAFELSDAAGDAPATKGKDDRRGLLIHDGNRGVTAGCIGIKGDFEQFKADLAAEMQKNGGNLKLQLGTPDRFKGAASTAIVSTNQDELGPDPEGATRVAVNVPRRAPPMRAGPMSEIIEGIQKLMPQWKNEQLRAVDARLKRMEKLAGVGLLPTDPEYTKTKEIISQVGYGADKLAAIEATAAITASQRQQSPERIRANAQAIMTAVFERGGRSTPEEQARVKALFAMAGEVEREIKKDRFAWVERVGLTAVPPITDASSMAARQAVARQIADHYGLDLELLKPKEAEHLGRILQAGGENAAKMLGSMYQVWGGDIVAAMKQIAPNAPEASRAGFLMGFGGDPKAVDDILKTLSRRNDPNYKREIKFDGLQAAAQETFGNAFKSGSQNYDATMRAAEAIYEQRMYDAGKDPKIYNSSIGTAALKAAVGGSTGSDGKDYGGVVETNTGVWGGKYRVVIPPNIRNKDFNDLRNVIKREHLIASGVGIPVDANGAPVSMAKVAKGFLVQIGPSQYQVVVKDANKQDAYLMTPGRAPPGLAAEAQDAPGAPPLVPFILDMKRLEPLLSREYSHFYKRGH